MDEATPDAARGAPGREVARVAGEPDGGRRALVFADVEPGRRNRRASDVVLLAGAALAAAGASVVEAAAGDVVREVGDALITLLAWAEPLWRCAFAGSLAFVAVLLLAMVLRRRWTLLRDALLALALAAGAGVLLGGLVAEDWFPAKGGLFSEWGFPEMRVAAAATLVAVAAPELTRSARLLGEALVALGAVGSVAMGAALPSSALAAIALGLASAAVVRLLFGSAAGMPATALVREALSALGIAVTDLAPYSVQRIGSAEYAGHDGEGRPIRVRVLGRDAQETQRMGRRWRQLAYRDPPRSVADGRLEQVEHEALATLLAAQAGVRVPQVVTATLGPGGDAVLVARQPVDDPLELWPPERVDDAMLEELWRQVAILHAAGIAHGRLNASNVDVTDDGPMLAGLSAATLAAPRSALDIDVAELLVACTALVGADRALAAALAGVGAPAVAAAVPYVQPAALTPHLRELVRFRRVPVDGLRTAAAEATDAEDADLVPVHRFRARDLLVTAAVAVAAYLLIAELAEIGFGTIAEELREADVPWVVAGLILAQLSFIGGALSVRGSVVTPVALWPCVVLQAALKVVNLTVPGSAGRIAFRVRFLQRMGAPTAEAVGAGAADELSELLVQVVLVLALLPLVDFDVEAGGLDAPPSGVVATVFVVLGAVVAVVLAVPALRRKVLPAIRPAVENLVLVAKSPRKRLELFGGNLLSELCYALCLGAVCVAYGVDLNLAQLLLVNLTASALSGLVPVPGGVGAEEAALTAGLVAVGVDESTAFAIALTHRFCTYYLPPIWGSLALRWLGREGYV